MKIKYDGNEAKIVEGLSPLDIVTLSFVLSYMPTGAEHSIYAKRFVSAQGKRVYNKKYRENFDPRIKLFNKRNWTFPTGLLRVVASHFPDVEVESVSPVPSFKAKQQISTLRDYQKEIVNTLVSFTRGIAEAPTGCGKTIITAELALRAKDLRVLVTVPSRDLLHQTVEELKKFTGEEIGIYGDSEKIIKRITVATIQSLGEGASLAKQTKKLTFDTPEQEQKVAWLKDIQYWIVDECHGAATDTYRAVSAMMPSTYLRHGLTATLRREDGSELALQGVLGPDRIKIEPTRLIEDGWLVKPRIELHYLDHKTYREGKQKQRYDTLYRLAVVDNPKRNEYILEQAERCIREGNTPALIMFERLDHGKNLLNLLKSKGLNVTMVTGEDKTDHRKKVRSDAQAETVDIILASVVWVTGVNIPNLRSLIVASGGRSAIQVVQRAGRVLRPYEGKTEALVIDLCDLEESYLQDQTNDRRYHYLTKYPGCVEGIEVEGLF